MNEASHVVGQVIHLKHLLNSYAIFEFSLILKGVFVVAELKQNGSDSRMGKGSKTAQKLAHSHQQLLTNPKNMSSYKLYRKITIKNFYKINLIPVQF